MKPLDNEREIRLLIRSIEMRLMAIEMCGIFNRMFDRKPKRKWQARMLAEIIDDFSRLYSLDPDAHKKVEDAYLLACMPYTAIHVSNEQVQKVLAALN